MPPFVYVLKEFCFSHLSVFCTYGFGPHSFITFWPELLLSILRVFQFHGGSAFYQLMLSFLVLAVGYSYGFFASCRIQDP